MTRFVGNISNFQFPFSTPSGIRNWDKKEPGQANHHALTNRLTLSNLSLRSLIRARLPGLYFYLYTASGGISSDGVK